MYAMIFHYIHYISLPRLTARGYSSSTPRFKDLQSVTILFSRSCVSSDFSCSLSTPIWKQHIWINLTNPWIVLSIHQQRIRTWDANIQKHQLLNIHHPNLLACLSASGRPHGAATLIHQYWFSWSLTVILNLEPTAILSLPSANWK